MRYLLDTDTCIDVLRGHPATVRQLAGLAPDDIAVSTITVFELHAGVARARVPNQETQKLSRFLDMVHVLPFLSTSAACAARIRHNLANRGTPIGPYDALIAGHALAARLTLVTANAAEFGRVPELSLASWRQVP